LLFRRVSGFGRCAGKSAMPKFPVAAPKAKPLTAFMAFAWTGWEEKSRGRVIAVDPLRGPHKG